jgi:hypothetical protein
VQQLVRVTVSVEPEETLSALDEQHPYLRLDAYGLPPNDFAELSGTEETDSAFHVLRSALAVKDEELLAQHADHFLKAPHILVPLFSHLSSLAAEENLRFPVHIKRLADQYRQILTDEKSPIRVHRIERNHLDTWADAQGKAFAFLDGGVARIAGLPGSEPTALRIGLYSVLPGETDIRKRERWALTPFVVGDLIDKDYGPPVPEDRAIDLRRLGEAARYTLEALVGLSSVSKWPDIHALFSHGPLINQFQMYDEGEPNYIPCLRREFLEAHGITEGDVLNAFDGAIPKAPSGNVLWTHFMAVYGHVITKLYESEVPMIGVVERSVGKWLAEAVLERAVEARLVTDSYHKKVSKIIKKYGIGDDFLFGCVLREGEYLTPVEVSKNIARRARPEWQQVVSKYPQPLITLLKTDEMAFPFRVEMNKAAAARVDWTCGLLYHMARLLPRYAFPVGLDIVDKYAKVPDWLSRNVSSRLAASVLSRAMAEGDANIVMQIRQLLAHTPRDFFYRPQA